MLELLQYDFFTNALLAALLSSVSCGIIGTYIVSRRMVFIGGGITHASFGGIGIAYYLGMNPIVGAAVFAVLSALGINYFSQNGNIRQDSSIAIWWSLGMAIGIVFIAITPGYSPNLMSFLFGSILTVTFADLAYMAVLSAILVILFSFFFRVIVMIAFDEEFARARNLPVSFFNYTLMALMALVIVASIRISGVILVLSLLTLPQATANLFTKDFRSIMIASVFIGLIGMLAGLYISYYTDLPSGATIILLLTALFLVGKLFLTAKGFLYRRSGNSF
ncbi:MAG TPA: metal ABC transporter permease [Prolixibacteraceae bacterium]|nr:metal ABC transporter permease [Bacteroidales bacterium]HPB06231.1 metal ABC transporter permease [Prolixibacteraceae bacterium]HUM88849.1 metal ABC transporter permease [Prolixibacteraceae bacterium]